MRVAAEGLGGQSGGPLVDFKTGEMLGVFALSDTDKHYTFDLQGNISGHMKVSTVEGSTRPSRQTRLWSS